MSELRSYSTDRFDGLHEWLSSYGLRYHASRKLNEAKPGFYIRLPSLGSWIESKGIEKPDEDTNYEFYYKCEGIWALLQYSAERQVWIGTQYAAATGGVGRAFPK